MLTSRLRRIIDDYADGPGILSELLQNADDAGATEVRSKPPPAPPHHISCTPRAHPHLRTPPALELDFCCLPPLLQVRFLVDEASHGTGSLLGGSMADWQGPALLVFNDSTFSPADFSAIARIGQDSKVDKPATAGRFGLGFNSVYHFTDVPSFVSGEYLVYFDPHAQNLPGTSLAAPGLKINATSGRLLLQFPDQFSPFLFFGCTLNAPFDGTLFRFPLRSAAAAARSEIKPEAYSLPALHKLIDAFRESAPRTLLFLKSVRKVSAWVSRPGPNGAKGEPELLYEASLDVPEAAADPRQQVVEFVRGPGGKANGQKQFLQRLASVPDNKLPANWGEVQARGCTLRVSQSASRVHARLRDCSSCFRIHSFYHIVTIRVSRLPPNRCGCPSLADLRPPPAGLS